MRREVAMNLSGLRQQGDWLKLFFKPPPRKDRDTPALSPNRIGSDWSHLCSQPDLSTRRKRRRVFAREAEAEGLLLRPDFAD